MTFYDERLTMHVPLSCYPIEIQSTCLVHAACTLSQRANLFRSTNMQEKVMAVVGTVEREGLTILIIIISYKSLDKSKQVRRPRENDL